MTTGTITPGLLGPRPLADARAPLDDSPPDVDMLSPLTLRGVRLKNRIAMAPVSQHCAEDGLANDWHLVHLGSRAVGGCALVFVEAAAVESAGRVSPGDVGLWADAQIEPLARIARFIETQGAVPAIQLAHAGRKGSVQRPWEGGARLGPEEGGWTVFAPSAVPFSQASSPPVALDAAGMERVRLAFEGATRRALEAGFKIIAVDAAGGHLLHEFLSPLGNYRDDAYGGNLNNRMRFVLEVAERVRRIVPEGLPMFVGLPASDVAGGGWDVAQAVALALRLRALGIDLVAVSSGGAVPHALGPLPAGHGAHPRTPTRRIRDEARIRTGATEAAGDARRPDETIAAGDADLAFLGRELLREPYWPLKVKHLAGDAPRWPTPYEHAVERRTA
jgi:2,4-dienoyl-CoA reductase-like NADH-dependent reductase (Old Yellow Enzyme family)